MSLRNLLLFGVFSSVVIATPFIVSLKGQNQEQSAARELKSPTRSDEDMMKDFPAIDFTTEAVVDATRAAKSSKYNKNKVLYPEAYTSENIKEVSFADWITAATPLPIAESDAVVLGKVVGATAYLSGNKNTVYSEFNIEVSKIFKGKGDVKLEDGKFIRAERDGGIVRFPSGNQVWYLMAGQRMPKVGSVYFLFLTHTFPLYGYQNDLFLLTGYEVKDGKVFPLDLADGGTHPTATFYRGKSIQVLTSDIKKALV